MSRHRFIRNLTEDDYYDVDRDDYYDEDGPPLSQRKPYAGTTSTSKKSSTSQAKSPSTDSKTLSTPQQTLGGGISRNKKVPTPSTAHLSANNKEKEQSLVSMGFTPDQARTALISNQYDMQLALENGLLVVQPSSTDCDTQITEKNTRTLPPPGFSPQPRDHELQSKQSTFALNKVAAVSPLLLDVGSKDIPQSDNTRSDNIPTTKTSSSNRKNRTMIDLFSSDKSRLSMIILGHVDAGKSTLMGQVLLQLGYVEKRTIQKYRKQAADMGKASFALAWVMDEEESEREHGVTMDIAMKTIITPRHVLTILDSPGHADFIPAMITGAAAADVGILVIAATQGEFEAGFFLGGQTREHVILARGLGVSQLVVAVNKLDSAQPAWSQARFDEIEKKLRPFLQSNGFQMKRVQFVPVSGLLGINISVGPAKGSRIPKSDEDGFAPDLAQWYTGPTLMEAIDGFEPAKRDVENSFRFIISDVYPEGKNVLVQGRVVQGFVCVGDTVVIAPVGDEAMISRMDHGFLGSRDNNCTLDRTQVAVAGDSVNLVLNQIDPSRIFPGNLITHGDAKVHVSNVFEGKIVVMDNISSPIIQGAEVLFHMHNIDIPAVVTKLIQSTNKRDGVVVQRPRVLVGGSNASVEIRLRAKICLETFQDCRALGRFALRREGDTLAVGIVESVK